MADSLRKLGHVFDPSTSLSEQVWGVLRMRAWYLREGKRVSLCRFQSVSGSLAANMDYWSIHEFESTYVALEEDFLVGKVFVERFAGGRSLQAPFLTKDARALY